MRRTVKIVLGVSFILFSLLLLISVLKFGSLFGLFFIYPWVTDWLSQAGLNPFIGKAIAVVFTIFLWFVIFRLIFKWGSGNKIFLGISKRTWGVILFIMFFVGQAAMMFYATKDSNFSSEGKALRYYTQNPITSEFQIFDYKGYDAFGQETLPITSEIAKEIEAQKMYPQAEIPKNQIKNFFDRLTGKPLVYYYQDEKNVCHFFVRPGFSPTTGNKLSPVTDEVKNKCDRGETKLGEEKKRAGEKAEEAEKRKIELVAQTQRLSEAQSDFERRKNDLEKEQERVRLEKSKLSKAAEQFRKEKRKFKQEKGSAVLDGESARFVSGSVYVKGGKKLEINLDLARPVGKR